MRKKITAVLAAGVVLTMSSVSTAHEPPNFIGIIWQWPADQTPILDGNMVEWSIIPDDYSLTTDKLQALFEPGDQFVTYTDPDLSSLDIRVTPSYVNGGSRIYYGYERFDDAWTSDDDIEIVIDADHTGGGFHGNFLADGATDEEKAREHSRQAQIYHVFLDDGFRLSGDRWNWMWMTSSDWQEQPPWSDRGYQYEGTPGSFAEVSLQGEFYLTAFDDYNSQDPDGSVQHALTEGEIIGHKTHVWDFDGTGPDTYRCDGCETNAQWSENTEGGSWGDANFLGDYLLESLETELLATSVEEDSWGAIKASVK